ncbi:uncharacterized protein isoform X1 [Danio rerio]|uniref:Uncharacterized protein isoform X1 n=2 Tax=Danio rerio TaxID=7955 RepID=A0AC58IHY5_DANRE
MPVTKTYMQDNIQWHSYENSKSRLEKLSKDLEEEVNARQEAEDNLRSLEKEKVLLKHQRTQSKLYANEGESKKEELAVESLSVAERSLCIPHKGHEFVLML